jgi:methionyl-tRNA formyltransferase
MLKSEQIEVQESNYLDLEARLALLGGEMVPDVLRAYVSGSLIPAEQKHEDATFTKKFKTEDGFVDFSDLQAALSGDLNLQAAINRKIRALNPDPGVYTVKDGKRIKLLESEVLEGGFEIKKIQLEGKTPTLVPGVIKSVLSS